MRYAVICALLASVSVGLCACNKAKSPEEVQANVAKATSEAAENNAKADAQRKQAEAQASQQLVKDRADAEARRCGNADPIVTAPMTVPSAMPRRSRNHPAATFIPGGYTHASAAPVAIRSATSVVGPGATASAALASAPRRHPTLKSLRALSTSGRFRSAEISVPTTNPPWTAIVNHAVCAEVRSNSATIGALAAVAENHSVIPKNMASDSQASCHRGDVIWTRV